MSKISDLEARCAALQDNVIRISLLAACMEDFVAHILSEAFALQIIDALALEEICDRCRVNLQNISIDGLDYPSQAEVLSKALPDLNSFMSSAVSRARRLDRWL